MLRMGKSSILMLVIFLTLTALTTAQDLPAVQLKTFKLERSMSKEARDCIDCHAKDNPGIVGDWINSRHANMNITCYDCHIASPADPDINKAHYEYSKVSISTIVSPKDCSRCHPSEAAQYEKSKHANTLELIWKIDPWLNHGQNNQIERVTGCQHCHGSIVEGTDGNFSSDTWPNVGVGRINPDGSNGSCSSCHTRHKFSLAEARKPEACGQCHLGPDHPQVEIFSESKHGAIYNAEGHQWKWDSAPGTWTPGVDYRSPTCSVCHMSAINDVKSTHDVTERLAWETQAPLTVRPSEFKAFPAQTDWKEERAKMEKVCYACHSKTWTAGHFDHMDKAIADYNDNYFKPMKKIIDELYEKKLLDKTKNLDEKLEVEMYELWHHEGRRARFGAAMMAPDYAWWHGFYELKKRSMEIEDLAEELIEKAKPAKVHDIKGAGGSTEKPKALNLD